MRLDMFLASYKETALWSSTDDAGEPLDSTKYANVEFTSNANARMENDCREFIARTADVLVGFTRADMNRNTDSTIEEAIAHDFWLTRNHHGAGFWDGDYPKELGQKLTDIAHSFGECNLYATEDSIECE